jgi:hypothetical protein
MQLEQFPEHPRTVAVPCAGGVVTVRLVQSIDPHVVESFASTEMSTNPFEGAVAVSSAALVVQTVIAQVAPPVQIGAWSFDTTYPKASGPVYPLAGAYRTTHPEQLPEQPTTVAVPCAGGDVIVRLVQSIAPQVVVSFASTWMSTDDPSHTVAESSTALVAQTVIEHVALPVHVGVWSLRTLYPKLSGPE